MMRSTILQKQNGQPRTSLHSTMGSRHRFTKRAQTRAITVWEQRPLPNLHGLTRFIPSTL